MREPRHRTSPATTAACTTALLATLAAAPAPALSQSLVYGTDFEPPTFAAGPLGDTFGLPNSGQDGWRALPREPYATAPSPWVTITTQRAFSGSQSLQLRMDASFYNGVNGLGASAWRDYAASPLVLNSPDRVFSVSMRLYLDQAPSSDLGWGLSFVNAIGGAGVRITPDDKLVYAHNQMNQPAVFTPGFGLHNTWLQLTLERDPLDWTLLRLSVSDGSRTWQQQVGGPPASMTTMAIGGVIPSFPVAAYGTAYVDDFRMGYDLAPVPEPASWALWLAGIGVLVARRRSAAVAR